MYYFVTESNLTLLYISFTQKKERVKIFVSQCRKEKKKKIPKHFNKMIFIMIVNKIENHFKDSLSQFFDK